MEVGMKRLVICVLIAGGTLRLHATAQRGGFHLGGGSAIRPGFGGHGMRNPGSFGLPPLGPIPPLGTWRNFNRFGSYGNGWGGLGWGYPAYGGYDGPIDYDGGYEAPMPMPEQETCSPVIVEPPPPPARPEIHEYNWQGPSDPQATFAIVAKDGSVHLAIAVWVQGNKVRYVAPDDSSGQLALESVDRAATRKVNADKHMVLPLN
jgi:hypothetical protein